MRIHRTHSPQIKPLCRIGEHPSAGQGLVEFTLILPLLLLVVLGIIEFSRLMAIYTTATSASREATRYAATVGVNAAGVPRYQDCDGIREAALRVNLFTNPTIIIQYDADGPGGVPAVEYCQPGKSVDPISTTLGSRVVVRATASYSPLVPLIDLPSFPIVSESKRTILRDVYVK